MSEQAPERTWLTKVGNDIVPIRERRTAEDDEYLHTDLSQALIAAKLHEAAEVVEASSSPGMATTARRIRALIPTDAQAALDAYVRKEVEKAIRACDPIIPSECGVSKEMKSLTPQLRHFFENHEKWVAAAIREAGHE